MCDLMFGRQNICIQQSMPFKILFRGLSKLKVFYGQLPIVEVDKNHDGRPSKYSKTCLIRTVMGLRKTVLNREVS